MSEFEHHTLAPEWTLRLVALLEALVGRVTFGERLSTLVGPATLNLTAAKPVCLYEYGGGFASIAVVNPNNFPVYLGFGANDAVPGDELVSIPPASWIVLPLKSNRLGVGSNGQVGSVHVLAFETAQQFGGGSFGAAAWAP